MKQFFGNTAFYIVLYFILLFDVDGAQLGLNFAPEMPNSLIQTASIFGNVLWLLGVMFLIVGVILFVTSFSDDVTSKMIKEKTPEEMEKMLKKPNILLLSFGIFTAMFATGSGFWFTGPSWLILIAGLAVWRSVITKAYDEYMKEKGEPRKFSAEEELKKTLLDD